MKLSSTETSSLCLWKPRIPLYKYLDTEYVSILNVYEILIVLPLYLVCFCEKLYCCENKSSIARETNHVDPSWCFHTAPSAGRCREDWRFSPVLSRAPPDPCRNAGPKRPQEPNCQNSEHRPRSVLMSFFSHSRAAMLLFTTPCSFDAFHSG